MTDNFGASLKFRHCKGYRKGSMKMLRVAKGCTIFGIISMNSKTIRLLVMLLLVCLVGCSSDGPGQDESVKYFAVDRSTIQAHFSDKGFRFASFSVVDVKHRPHFLGTLGMDDIEVATIELVVSPDDNEQVSAVGMTTIVPPRGAQIIVEEYLDYLTFPSIFGSFFVTDWDEFKKEYLLAFSQVFFSSSPSKDKISVTHNDLRFEFARLPDAKIIVLVQRFPKVK